MNLTFALVIALLVIFLGVPIAFNLWQWAKEFPARRRERQQWASMDKSTRHEELVRRAESIKELRTEFPQLDYLWREQERDIKKHLKESAIEIDVDIQGEGEGLAKESAPVRQKAGLERFGLTGIVDEITQHKGWLLPEDLWFGRDVCSVTVSVGHDDWIGLKVATLDSAENASIVMSPETAEKVANMLENVVGSPGRGTRCYQRMVSCPRLRFYWAHPTGTDIDFSKRCWRVPQGSA